MNNNNEKFDITVIGGGISGIACAYISSKLGLKTLLTEKNDYLGGLITGGLVVPMMKNNSKGINQDFLNDLILYSKKYNAQIEYGDKNPFWFHPLKLKNIFFKMLNDTGCKIFLNSNLKNNFFSENNFIKKIEIEQKGLSIPIYSKYYIDGTGNGSFSKILNCEFLSDADDKKQSMSLRFLMSGVNPEKLADFLLNYDKDRDVTTAYKINGEYYLSSAYTWDKNRSWALKPLFERAIKDNVIREEDSDYFQIFSVASEPSTIAFNCPKLKLRGDYSSNGILKALNDAREAIERLADFCRIYLPGFENAYVSEIADMIGIRENGRVRCKHTFTLDDIIGGKMSKTPVLHSDYPIDIHSDKKDKSTLKQVCGYYLPIESLMSYDYENLFITGRCLGASFEAQASLRIQPNCASMGEGIAKYIYSLETPSGISL